MIDLKVIESFDGGDLVLKGNDLEVVSGFGNMPYLAMFGGNDESTPTQRVEGEQNFDFWGNTFIPVAAQYNSLTEKTLRTVSLNSSGRLQIEQAVKRDLKFMEAFAKLDISVTILGVDKVKISIKQTELTNQEVKESSYLWDGALQDLTEEVRPSTRPIPITGFAVVKNTSGSFTEAVNAGSELILPNPNLSFNGSVEGQIVSQDPVSVNLSDGTNPITPDVVNLVGNTLGITILPPFFGFEPEYRKVLLVAQGMGMTLPSSGVQVLQNQLLIDLKSAGAWVKDDILYVMAQDGSAEFACLNWKNPINYYLRRINAITFVPNQGLAGDGVSAYLDTRFDPSVDGLNYTLNNASRYAYLFSAAATGAIDGAAGGNDMIIQSTGQQRINSNSMSPGYAYGNDKEMKSIHRPDSATQWMYKAKVGESRANPSTSLATSHQRILRAGGLYGQHTVSFYSMGANQLAENNDKVDAFDNYINAL